MKVGLKFTFWLGLLTSVVLATLLSARSADYRQRANWAKRNTYEKLMRELNELEPRTGLNHIAVNRGKMLRKRSTLDSYEKLMQDFNRSNKPHNGMDHISPRYRF